MPRSLTAAGLQVKTLDEIRKDIQDKIHGSSEWGTNENVGPDSGLGQIIDAVAEEVVELDDMAQAVYDAYRPDSAEGVQLDDTCAYTGATRKSATYSTVTVTLTGTPTTPIPAGTRYRVPSGPIFATDEDVEVGGGGTVDAASTCTETGPKEAAAGSVTEIVDAISGIDSVTNAEDAVRGTDVEKDVELRVRRENDIALPGSSTDQALRANLEELPDVQHATVISNRELETDSNGIPGKSFRSVLWPASGLDEDRIALTIWDHMPTGIRPDGTVEKTITDDQDQSVPVRWSYATVREIYLIADVTPGASYPVTGDDLLKAALLTYGNAHRPGDDVRPDRFEAVPQLGYAPLEIDEIPGIDEITVRAKIGDWPGSGDTGKITIALTEIARFDSARIQVNS